MFVAQYNIMGKESQANKLVVIIKIIAIAVVGIWLIKYLMTHMP